MMIVEINGQQYDVAFSHFTDTVNPEDFYTTPSYRKSKQIWQIWYRKQTVATFYEIVDGKRTNRVVEGVAVVHPNDRFCRYTGRKVAFSRALTAFPREVRNSAWQAFFSKFGSGPKKKN